MGGLPGLWYVPLTWYVTGYVAEALPGSDIGPVRGLLCQLTDNRQLTYNRQLTGNVHLPKNEKRLHPAMCSYW